MVRLKRTIYIAFACTSMSVFSGDVPMDFFDTNSVINIGDTLHYPYHQSGLVTYDKLSREWYLDGVLSDKIGEDIVERKNLPKDRNSILVDSVFGKLGFSSGERGGRVQVILDYTCPYSAGYYKELKRELSKDDFDAIEFLPMSRNMDKTVMVNSLGIACLPESDRAIRFEYLMDNKHANVLGERCGNAEYLYGILNVLNVLGVKEVPAVFVNGIRKDLGYGSTNLIAL